MTQEEYDRYIVAQHARILENWRRIEETAKKAGNEVFAKLAREQIDRLEPPPGLKAGDLVARITSALGIPPCEKCKERQKAMNEVDMNQPVVEVVKGLVKAVFK